MLDWRREFPRQASRARGTTPTLIAPTESDFTTWRCALVCADGAPAYATVRISGTAERQARTYLGFCCPGVFEAVYTVGRSVIETRLLS